MNAPILSNLWYRVADLKPRLRAHAVMHRHHYRGEVWRLLQDPASGRVHRFSPAAQLIIGLMDGERTVATLWDIAKRRLGDDAPTQDEMIQLLGQLHTADLLQSDVAPDVAEIFDRSERDWRARQRQAFGNPMAIRIGLWDPDRFLNRMAGPIQFIWSGWGALIWLSVVLPALALVPAHWPELSHNFADRILAVDNLVVLYMVFPLIKAAHEMGHATAIKAGGGEVHEIGVILLVLLPVPFVEASAASAFRSKYRRAVVGAAGMAVEVFIAALAFYLWLLVEPGLTRAALFNVMVIAGVSTLVFNGNPLLRYDAYYILSDLIEIPNLSMRAARYWIYLAERYVLGAWELEPPHATLGEKAWFLFYGAASTIYRMIITIVIALFIASRFFFIGVVLALWAVAAMAVVPVVRGVLYLTSNPRLQRRRDRIIAMLVGAIAAISAFVFFVPLPSHTEVEGVVWLPDQSFVRAEANGVLVDYLARPGSRVEAGEKLIRLEDRATTAQYEFVADRVQELDAAAQVETAGDRARAELALKRLDSEKQDLAIISGKLANLETAAKTSGQFVVPQPEDLIGRYFHKGELIGHVIGDVDPIVRAVVPQDAVDRVRATTDHILVRVVDEPGTTWKGKIVRAVPGGDDLLPSRALAFEGGGEIATDPRDTKAAKALRRVFQFDIALIGAREMRHFGQRAYVRFEHQDETLSQQIYRAVRLLFLTRFNA
ncbi:peptidase M50 [Rhodoblastus acidophilus]|uniref:Peptidase M50 n=1 Tax=Candidatus Rhodoblastus alkanivorans TaxID=2954117 RepID=A0ABS9Z2Z6_9HYPH|nr:peptidase M50 [Candidatus Rhodoblastus alkanivorans]MCI4677309.1 peptidase M50 [Candidatus Rhodoblastus alkanivorans]MCI4682044.1 peptidase M50 [Candidatus Rhodoblastus alkanivorans]MDI4639346.1 peptidase M50 [Rhodoblastus acidophilus]